MPISRRDALTVAAGAAAATAFSVTSLTRAEAARRRAWNGFRVGCQAYSFNRYSVFEAIEKTAQVGGTVIEFYPGQKLLPAGGSAPDQHIGPDLTPDSIALLKDKLAKFGITPVAFGVQALGGNEQADRRVFEFARTMSLQTITSEPNAKGMDQVEKLVKEYDIRVAIHNHPKRPNDPNYKNWDPEFILSLVKGRDKRIGSCADIGHWVRSGIKPLDALHVLEGRILQTHLKDLNMFGPGAHDVPYGTGISDIPAILAEYKRHGFDGCISIEYEYHWETSVPEIAQCVGFVRGWDSMNK